jgi:hypothetical protein
MQLCNLLIISIIITLQAPLCTVESLIRSTEHSGQKATQVIVVQCRNEIAYMKWRESG